MKKILFGLVLVLFGIFALYYQVEMDVVNYHLWDLFTLFPFIGIGFGIWGLLEKDK